MNRHELLMDAAGPLNEERASTYGSFDETMRRFGKAARKMFTEQKLQDKYGDAHNGALLMEKLKIIRITVGDYHEDNYRDGVNYLAQANESERLTRGLVRIEPEIIPYEPDYQTDPGELLAKLDKTITTLHQLQQDLQQLQALANDPATTMTGMKEVISQTNLHVAELVGVVLK